MVVVMAGGGGVLRQPALALSPETPTPLPPLSVAKRGVSHREARVGPAAFFWSSHSAFWPGDVSQLFLGQG